MNAMRMIIRRVRLMVVIAAMMITMMPVPALPVGQDLNDPARDTSWVDWSPFSYPFNMTRQPAASIPCGLTGAGLPIVSLPKSARTCVLVQVLPWSKLRFKSRSISPESLPEFRRPSQKASSVPFLVVISAGMRYVW